MGSGPSGVDPGRGNGIGRVKVGSIWAVRTGASFDPIVFFDDAFRSEDYSCTPKEILEVKWAGSYSMTFFKVVVKGGVSSVSAVVDIPTVVLEIS